MEIALKKSTLFIFSGLPASGKSTLAKELAKKINATYIRIDTVEQGLKSICKLNNIEGEGYRLSYLLAKDNLQAGNNVIADSVNPWKLSREEWNNVAVSVGSEYVNIEIICSDKDEHKKRAETRSPGVPGLKNPTWKEIEDRDYHEWKMPRIIIDTAGKSINNSLEELLTQLNKE